MQPEHESEPKSTEKSKKGDDPQGIKNPSSSPIIQYTFSEQTREESLQALTERIQQLESEKEALRLELWKHKRRPSGIAGYTLLLLGTIALILSVLYSSIIPAFIGLGLVFWGILFLYIRPSRYVRASLLDSTAISSLITLNKIITDLNYEGKGIYLPPRYLREVKGGTVFIPSKKESTMPLVEELPRERVFLNNPNGICLPPPGLGLANLYEDELGKDFARTDLNYLQMRLPKLFIEDLEIAEDLEFSVENNVIQVKMTGSIYQDFCNEVKKLKKICGSLGCPLCSSIALAITRATGKPVIIQKTEISEEGKTIRIQYKTLEE